MTLISSIVIMSLLRSWGEGYEYVTMSHSGKEVGVTFCVDICKRSGVFNVLMACVCVRVHMSALACV